MRLRPRQSLFVERSLAALCDHGNTLSIASTGFGKTIALSAVVAKSLEASDAKACILAHRDELTAQNRAKFGRVAPDISTSVVDAEAKSWAGRATFAMVPTLSRPANLAAMGGDEGRVLIVAILGGEPVRHRGARGGDVVELAEPADLAATVGEHVAGLGVQKCHGVVSVVEPRPSRPSYDPDPAGRAGQVVPGMAPPVRGRVHPRRRPCR